MSDQSTTLRQRGKAQPKLSAESVLLNEGIGPTRILQATRMHLPLFLIVLGMILGITVLATLTSRPDYSARAVIRMASERRTLTSGVEDLPQPADRPVDPVLSAVQVLTSRTLVGAVVDSLGLRLQPVHKFSADAPLFGRDLPGSILGAISVDSAAVEDTLLLKFSAAGITARSRHHLGTGVYGQPMAIGPVSLSIQAGPSVPYAVLAIEPRDVAIDDALRALKVTARPGTDVIDVRFTDSNPARAQQFSNTLVRLFQAANGHSAQAQARRRREFLGDQLGITDSLLALAAADLSLFRSRQQMGSSRDNLSAEQASAAALQAQETQLRADRRVFTALLDRVKSSSAADQEDGFRALAYAPEVTADPVLATLQQNLLDYRRRLDSLTTGPWRSLPTHPDVVQLNTLLKGTREEMTRAVQARLTSIDARLAVLSGQRAQGKQSIQGLPAKEAAEASLDRKLESLRSTADALRQEYQKARISEALGAADIEVLDFAPLPYRKSGLPRPVEIALGLLFGLAIATATAVLAELTNRRVRRPEELQESLGTLELGIIPRIAQLGTGTGVVRQLPPGGANEIVFSPSGALSQEAEAFRMLRMSLAFSWGERPCTLVVTSAAPQEGKTLIATNLAATFARGGADVLLVDCDIHRPRLHKVFQVPRSPGLMDLLRPQKTEVHEETARRVALNQRLTAVRRTSIERLSLLPCGVNAVNTPELLEPATLQSLLGQFKTEYDVIVLDTPPVLVSADAATLAASAEGVILVVRAGQTERGAAELARQRVSAAGGRILGAVLNDPDGLVSRMDAGYYAYDYPAAVD
jgi:polysaccharide biosynthesis transport protein